MAADPTNEPNVPPPTGLIPDPNASETDKILGITATQPNATRDRIDPKSHRLYDQLVRQRDELIDASTDLTAKAREVNPDPIQDEPAEVGTSTFHRDQLLGVVTLDQELLSEINEAISRMEGGTYGICLATGKPIPMERLEAIPWTRFTAEAQQDMEARGEATKAAIGAQGDFRDRGTAPAGPWREEEGSR
jgi:RNA polymerase-binding transcription factor DksA